MFCVRWVAASTYTAVQERRTGNPELRTRNRNFEDEPGTQNLERRTVQLLVGAGRATAGYRSYDPTIATSMLASSATVHMKWRSIFWSMRSKRRSIWSRSP